MSKGKVKYFNEHKGWGIIAGDESEENVYVHYTAINMDGYKTLREGQEVLFELVDGNEGPSASNVTLAQ
ncbi:MAG: cold shock domain-containing protein [candidate division Zixibacteria bacterium]|nr:cold shock domain-containing protein [candidate division Zixibacteria bacterium]